MTGTVSAPHARSGGSSGGEQGPVATSQVVTAVTSPAGSPASTRWRPGATRHAWASSSQNAKPRGGGATRRTSDAPGSSIALANPFSSRTGLRLERPVLAMGRRFTVEGFLWALYGHHCYHFGQIDLLMRQQDVTPPEFIQLPELERVIA